MSLQNRSIGNTTRYSPSNIQRSIEPNKIYLMARNAGPGVDHYFYLYKNDNGEMFSISAFPKNDRSKSQIATLQNLNDGGGGWGNIVSKVAKYNSNSPDWGAATLVEELSSSTNNPQETAKAWQYIQRGYERIHYADKPYLLASQNSNTAATTVSVELARRMEIVTVEPRYNRTDVFAPGTGGYIDTERSGKSSDKRVSPSGDKSANPELGTLNQNNNDLLSTGVEVTQVPWGDNPKFKRPNERVNQRAQNTNGSGDIAQDINLTQPTELANNMTESLQTLRALQNSPTGGELSDPDKLTASIANSRGVLQNIIDENQQESKPKELALSREKQSALG
jgi:hypothetical protein